MTLTVRRARESELDDVAKVVSAAYAQHRSIPGSERMREAIDRYLEDVLAVHARAAEEGVEIYVALDEDRIVGTGTLYGPGRSKSYAKHLGLTRPWPDDWASLRVLAVEPSFRGRGIGKALIDARVKRAFELEADAVALHTSPIIEAAHRLVNGLGFERAPALDYFPVPEIHAEAYVLRHLAS